MKYILLLISASFIGFIGFQLSPVSAQISTKVVSGETKIITKKVVVNPKIEIQKLKRSIAIIKAKLLLLETKIKKLKATIETRTKHEFPVISQERQLKLFVQDYEKTNATFVQLQQKLQSFTTSSGASSK